MRGRNVFLIVLLAACNSGQRAVEGHGIGEVEYEMPVDWNSARNTVP